LATDGPLIDVNITDQLLKSSWEAL